MNNRSSIYMMFIAQLNDEIAKAEKVGKTDFASGLRFAKEMAQKYPVIDETDIAEYLCERVAQENVDGNESCTIDNAFSDLQNEVAQMAWIDEEINNLIRIKNEY